tara:strand:+ start:593 stop:802 length:210 start_codon:yes stop_codon:yes gene_type:complete
LGKRGTTKKRRRQKRNEQRVREEKISNNELWFFLFIFLVIMGVYDYYFEYGIIAELVGRLVVWFLEWIF